MRLFLILSDFEPTEITPPSICYYKGCGGKRFRFHQVVGKPLRDSQGLQVNAHRYECLRCGRTFRVYPKGVSKAHTSQRVKSLGMLLYLMGLSYGSASRALDALGVYMSKSQIYDAVQQMSRRLSGLKRRRVFAGIKNGSLGSGSASVQVRGHWRPMELVVDDTEGLVLSIGDLTAQDANVLQGWMAPVAASVGAQISVADDDGQRDEYSRVDSRVPRQAYYGVTG
jgi:hypothetical protein